MLARSSPLVLAVICLFLLASSPRAQEPSLEPLGFLAGAWIADGDSPELGRYTEELRIEWRHERRFLHGAYRMTAADGRLLAEETVVIGKDAVMDKRVTFHFAADGTLSRGIEVAGRRGSWAWEGNRHGPRRRDQFRLTLSRVHDDAFVWALDTRIDDSGAWQPWSSTRFRRVVGGTATALGTDPGDADGERGLGRTGDPMAGRSPRREPRPGRHVRVQIDRFTVDAADTEAFEAALRYRNAGLDISAGALGGRNGLIVAGADDRLAGALRVSRTRGFSRETSQSFLLVMEGGEALLESVERQLVPRTVIVPVYQGALIVRTIEEEVTGSGFRVRIDRAEPDAVELELAPYFHRARRGDTLVVAELATRLSLIPGRPYTILAQRDGRSTVASALLSSRRADRQVETIHVLTVFVEGE